MNEEAQVVEELAPPVPEVESDEGESFVLSPEIGELFAALSLAQGVMHAASKSASNDYYKSKYADLESVMAVIREPFSSHGLSVTQVLRPTSKGTMLITVLGHKSGQWVRSECPIRPEKNTIHAIGSAITYMRRYCLSAIAGVSTADDDGNAASGI